MKTLSVYDPPMCCSTGVCGPGSDPKLLKFVGDLAFLKSRGVKVSRFNLAHQPTDFTANRTVMAEMGEQGEHLPILIADGQLKVKGRYPDRAELASWFDLDLGPNTSKPAAFLRMAE